MTPENKTESLERRCPRLGGSVTFEYCQSVGKDGLPCWKVFDCWWETFDVVAHYRKRLTPEAFERLAAMRPKPKITSLLEIVEQAQKRAADDASSPSHTPSGACNSEEK